MENIVLSLHSLGVIRIFAASTVRALALPLLTVCLAVCYIADLRIEVSLPGTLVVGCSHREGLYELPISRSQSLADFKCVA